MVRLFALVFAVFVFLEGVASVLIEANSSYPADIVNVGEVNLYKTDAVSGYIFPEANSAVHARLHENKRYGNFAIKRAAVRDRNFVYDNSFFGFNNSVQGPFVFVTFFKIILFPRQSKPCASHKNVRGWGLSDILKFNVQVPNSGCRGFRYINFDLVNVGAQLPLSGVFGYFGGLPSGEQSPADKPNAQNTSQEGYVGKVSSFPLRCKIASVRTPLFLLGLFLAFGLCFIARWGFKDWKASPLAFVLCLQIFTGVIVIFAWWVEKGVEQKYCQNNGYYSTYVVTR